MEGEIPSPPRRRRKTPIRPLWPQQRRRVARWGLAMDNLKSDWNFSAPSLTPAGTSNHFALRIRAVDLKNTQPAAEALINNKKFLAGAKISVEVADIKAKPLRDGWSEVDLAGHLRCGETASEGVKNASTGV